MTEADEIYGLHEVFTKMGSEIVYTLEDPNKQFEQLVDYLASPASALTIRAKLRRDGFLDIKYFMRAIGTKDLYPNLGKIGMCRFLTLVNKKYNVDAVTLEAIPLKIDNQQPTPEEREKLVKYYTETYGFFAVQVKKSKAVLMEASVQTVLDACELAL
jgi:hypothetical protein